MSTKKSNHKKVPHKPKVEEKKPIFAMKNEKMQNSPQNSSPVQNLHKEEIRENGSAKANLESEKNATKSNKETNDQYFAKATSATNSTNSNNIKGKSGQATKNSPFWENALLVNRILAVSLALVALLSTIFVSGYWLPDVVLQQTDDAKASRQRKEAEEKERKEKEANDKLITEENKVLKFEDQTVSMNIKDFGELKIELKEEAAPKTVENFVRLVHRDYFDQTSFHRIVEAENFSVIQGGDPEGTGAGGKSAFGTPIPDELWEVKPEFDLTAEGGRAAPKNEPKFRYPDFYQDFKPETSQVTYRKGLILMAKTAAPDSATSQFFITLDTTILPAEYTVFGQISEDTMPILDKISKEVDPQMPPGSEENPYKDGKPTKPLLIEEAKIV